MLAGKATTSNSTVQESRTATSTIANGCYRAVAPDGRQITIPQELFAALSEFMKIKKCAGSVTIDFRCDEIVGLEALTKKRLPNKR